MLYFLCNIAAHLIFYTYTMSNPYFIQPQHQFSGHSSAVYALAAHSPDHFFSADGNGWLVRWHTQQPTVGTAFARLPNSIFALQYLPWAQLLAVGTIQGVFYWVDTVRLCLIEPPLQLPASIFALHPYQHLLLAGTADGVLHTLDSHSQQVLFSQRISTHSLRHICTMPQQPHIAAIASSDTCLHIVDVQQGRLLHRLQAHNSSVFSACFSPDGRWLISGSRDASLCIWDTQHWQLSHRIPAHLSTINSICHHPTKAYFATASRDKTIKIWDSQRFELRQVIAPEKTPQQAHNHSVNCLLALPNQLLSGSDDQQIRSWQW